ncbi:[protein-PII] uridylyltransferase [Aestuariivirga sp.]|uniref:[protein-PII] uridylyltransferase n=1 Tax=Aestuariivirga sp. TaxID=2650926 RepID=UPI0039E3F1FF
MTTSFLPLLAFPDKLKALLATPGQTPLVIRTASSKLIRECLNELRAEAEKRLLRDGHGTGCAIFLSEGEDAIIRALFDFARLDVFKSGQLPLAVVAVGGYGRGTLAPGSDIDLLFLTPSIEDRRVGEVVEFLLYALWDARQKVGHATRTVSDCVRLAKTDNTIMTAVLEARFICGDSHLFSELQSQYRTGILQKEARRFVTEKLAERDQRHIKSGESRYAVEPDLKDGKGGLRDLHTLFWIAKFIFDANSPSQLAEKGAFSHDDLKRFQKAEDFLWAVRCHLHFIAKRGEDKLSFDRQGELAERMGYKAHGGLMREERFMKHYFLYAKEVGDLTRIFCASLEAQHLKEPRSLTRMIGKLMPRPREKSLGKAFAIDGLRLTISSDDVFAKDPVNLIRIFKVSASETLEIHPDALKRIRASLRLIDEGLRNNREANALFLSILTESNDPESILRLMNEAGVLGRFIPDFGKVVAMMQFNMYHHYTVDEHLIRTVGVLRQIETGTLSGDHPLSVKLFPTLTSRRALYVAALFHDIAKGRDEDHSIAGERIALAVCPRLGLDPAETETVAWLIRHHLLMSETAQMRDLNDFKTILDFTSIVQSPERLKLLLILTVADIRAVGPGVWNGWKGQLLRTLFAEAEPVLTGGHAASSRKDRVLAAQNEFLSKFPDWSDKRKQREAARHYDAYWLNVPLDQQLRHQALIDKAPARDVITEVRSDAFTAVTELTVYAPDHPRLLALITGACAAANANIIGAQIFTTTDGMALDTILLRREFKMDEDENRRGARVADTIARTLRGQLRLKDVLQNVPGLTERVKAFSVPPRVIIDNTSSNRQTVIEINGLDRVGLLQGLTEALFHLNLNIASAHVTTFGEKAVDVFYVTDLTGAKIENPTRHAQIEKRLMQVLAPETGTLKTGT